MNYISNEEIDKLGQRERVQLVNSVSGHKPIALIGTKSAEGEENLAIFNSLFHLGADPSLLGFVSRPNSVPRNTIENIRDTGFYTINHVSTHLYKNAHQTSARYDKNQNEFIACDIDQEYLDSFPIPFVKSSPLKMKMKLEEIIEIKLNNTLICIGSVQGIFYNEKLLEDGSLDIQSMDLVCGSGVDTYYSTKFLEKMAYAKT